MVTRNRFSVRLISLLVLAGTMVLSSMGFADLKRGQKVIDVFSGEDGVAKNYVASVSSVDTPRQVAYLRYYNFVVDQPVVVPFKDIRELRKAPKNTFIFARFTDDPKLRKYRVLDETIYNNADESDKLIVIERVVTKSGGSSPGDWEMTRPQQVALSKGEYSTSNYSSSSKVFSDQ